MNKQPPIEEFQGQYRWLSNFWPAPVELDGVTYPSVEHAYQASKTYPEHRELFHTCTAGQAKRLGRQVEMRPEFQDKKVHIMDQLIKQKFAFGTELAECLLDTGNAYIMEGNHWGDTFWGVCHGKGQNFLGRLIMDQRDRLFAEERNRG